MDATRCLRDEHQVILKMLDCFAIALQQARDSNTVSREAFDPFVEFFRSFADKCHHCRRSSSRCFATTSAGRTTPRRILAWSGSVVARLDPGALSAN